MRQITVYAAVANAASRAGNGKERRILDSVAEFLQGDIAGTQVIEFDDDESTAQIGHICPHCKREPVPMAMHNAQFGPIPVILFSCSGCRKVISVQVMPIVPQPDSEREEFIRSSLVLPGRR